MALRVLKVIISIAYFVLVRPFYRYCSKHRERSIAVIYYHSIPRGEQSRFARQMDYLVEKTIPVPLDFRGPYVRNAKYSIVTFDDAFQSLIDRGIPVLLDRHVPFAVFLPAGFLGNKPGWLEDPAHRDETDTIATGEALLAIPPDLVIFGSHTISHRHLPSLEKSEAVREILESKIRLEALTRRRIDYLSFPFGDYSREIVELCREAGYRQVFTNQHEPAFSPPDKFVKGRISVDPSDSMLEFKLKLTGSYAWMPLASSLKKIIKNAAFAL